MSSVGNRIHSMDALRASTMLLLVPVHASMVIALNGDGGVWATGLYWVVHVFRMPLFFAMSGFFLALLLKRKGLRETARNRTVRIVVPLAVGLVTLAPATIFAAQQVGAVLAPGEGPPTGTPFELEPSFLWFLWYLLIVDAAAVALYLWAPRLLDRAGERFRSLIAHPVPGILLLAIPTTLALWPERHWTAVPSVDTFVPQPQVLAYYALFFGLGATLCVHRGLVAAAGRSAWAWAACALAATVPAALLFTFHNSPHASRPLVHGAALLVYAVATWTSLIALVGLAHRYIVRPRPALRYMADASYWIYLSHMPAVVLLAALLGATALGTAPRFALVTAGALAFSMLTYPLLVRYTVIGRVLNGPRERHPQRGSQLRQSPPSAARGASWRRGLRGSFLRNSREAA